jgi:redox-sensitive bicupin YhaK (pirin superfamily)
MKEPTYQAVAKIDMPVVADLVGDVRLVCGTFASKTGPVKGQFPLSVLMGELAQGDELPIEKLESHNAILYLLDGGGTLNGYGLVEGKTLYQFVEEAVSASFRATQNTRFIYLSAQPLNEKVTHYGPFVMTTQTEILEAMRDYQMGKMGFLVEEL